MNSKPGKSKQTRAEAYSVKQTDTYTPSELELPDIYPCDHIAAYLFEVGVYQADGVLSWPHVESWCRLTGVVLSEFEAVTVVQLAREYAAMQSEAKDTSCPMPRVVERTADERAAVAKRLREALHMHAPKEGKGGRRGRAG